MSWYDLTIKISRPYMRIFYNTLISLAVLCLGLTSFAQSSHAQMQIQNIEVQGVERIDPQTVISYLGVNSGDAMSASNLDYALKNLFATGLFADVSLSQQAGTLVVNVVENPVVNEIVFEGNDKIDDDELLSEISLRPRKVFTRTQVQNDVGRIHQLYHRNGRFSASVDPKIIKLDQNRDCEYFVQNVQFLFC